MSRPVLFPRALAFAAIFALVSTGGFAKESALIYLKDGKPEAATLLAPPPAPDSAEAEADLNEVRAVYHAASSNDMAAAYAEKSFSVFNFAGRRRAVSGGIQPAPNRRVFR